MTMVGTVEVVMLGRNNSVVELDMDGIFPVRGFAPYQPQSLSFGTQGREIG